MSTLAVSFVELAEPRNVNGAFQGVRDFERLDGSVEKFVLSVGPSTAAPAPTLVALFVGVACDPLENTSYR